MTAQNPPTRKQDPGLWTFGTYLSVRGLKNQIRWEKWDLLRSFVVVLACREPNNSQPFFFGSSNNSLLATLNVAEASDYPTTPVLDKELQAVGFRIDNMMRDARLTALTQVDGL